MSRAPGRPIEELVSKQKVEMIRQAYLTNTLPSLQLLADALGVSRSMVGKIIHNKAHYSHGYEHSLGRLKDLKMKFLEKLRDV